MKKTILHLCADIGSDSWFYANDDEYEVIKVGKEIGVENFNPPENVYGVIANPVCTEFSFAKWANNKGDGDVEEGMFLVNHCLRIIKQCNPTFWAIENPATGRLKEFLGVPKLTYQPYTFISPSSVFTAIAVIGSFAWYGSGKPFSEPTSISMTAMLILAWSQSIAPLNSSAI